MGAVSLRVICAEVGHRVGARQLNYAVIGKRIVVYFDEDQLVVGQVAHLPARQAMLTLYCIVGKAAHPGEVSGQR